MRWWDRVIDRIARRHQADDTRGHMAAERHMRRIKRQQPEVDRLVESLREELHVNSFQARMRKTFRGETS